MDYEVFLVSRMREEWDNGLDNAEAVAQGLAKTGRIVTAAGLIMFAAFMGFVAGSIVGLQQFGFGLAMAILLDVTIVPRAARPERDGADGPLESGGCRAGSRGSCASPPRRSRTRARRPCASVRPLARLYRTKTGDG